MERNEALENGTELDELVRILHIAEANRDACRALLNALESDVVRLSRALIEATVKSQSGIAGLILYQTMRDKAR
jgi:hypothetical protein